MKYAIVIPDGAADRPRPELGGKTPLEAARTPNLDALAKRGVVTRACHTPDELPAGSEIGNLSLLGYDPFKHFTGRAPMEAAAQDIRLGPNDWAVRCNIVSIADGVMRDFTADHISTQDAAELLAAMQDYADSDPKFREALEFRPGVSYRNLLVWRGDDLPPPFTMDTTARAPHDITDQPVFDEHPRGPGSDVLVELMSASERIFAAHPLNAARMLAGRPPASHVWLWGLGRAPSLAPFAEKFGLRGTMITAVDLLRGIAKLAGWEVIEVPGATGYLDTSYRNKGQHAIEAIDRYDVVCVHVEAPDEASHEGRCDEKVRAIEQIDEHIVGPLVAKLEACGDWRLLVCPDHPTFLETKKHSHGTVPVLVAGSDVPADSATSYGETWAADSSLGFDRGWELMPWFLGDIGR